jgi:hypothetical protein
MGLILTQTAASASSAGKECDMTTIKANKLPDKDLTVYRDDYQEEINRRGPRTPMNTNYSLLEELRQGKDTISKRIR